MKILRDLIWHHVSLPVRDGTTIVTLDDSEWLEMESYADVCFWIDGEESDDTSPRRARRRHEDG